MATERDALVAEVDRLLRTLGRATRREPAALTEAGRRLTMGQYRLLRTLARADGPLTVGALGERLGPGPGPSRMVDRLVKDGLVDRRDDPTDRRRVLVGLTDAGLAALAEIRGGWDPRWALREHLARLDPAHLRQLGEALRALANVAGAEADAPT